MTDDEVLVEALAQLRQRMERGESPLPEQDEGTGSDVGSGLRSALETIRALERCYGGGVEGDASDAGRRVGGSRGAAGSDAIFSSTI